jgi:predicted acetyltransferase
MTPVPLLLRPLEVGDEASFKNAVAEFAREMPPWQFAFGFDASLPFAEYVAKLKAHSRGVGVPAGFVPNTYLVGAVDEVIVGRLSLRHVLNDALSRIGGHLGYGVIPSQRRRGHATAMLRQALPICAGLGIERALLTCDEDNIASRRVIQRCGGILENLRDDRDSGIPKLRYWLPTGSTLFPST